MPWRHILKLGKNDILHRLAGLSRRERLLSAGTVVGIVFYGFYLLIYAPIAAEKLLLAQKINVQQLAFQQLKKISAEAVALRKNNPDTVGNKNAQSLMAVIDSSSKQLEVKPAIKRMMPDGIAKVTLWLEGIAFDQLIYWLSVLETKHAITVDQIGISREQTKNGSVNAKLLLSI
jgi:general secretion pathway protein M